VKGRKLNENDISGFFASADRRPRYRPRVQVDLKKMLYLRNPWRWRRMQSDMEWARKQLQKAGYDPEEIRWLL